MNREVRHGGGVRRGTERYKPVEGYDVGTQARHKYSELIVRKAGLFPSDRILDVQTNTGILGVNLARAFTRTRTVATDAIRENLELARENARAERCADRIDFVLCLPDELPFKDEVFTFTTTGFMLAIEEDPMATLDEMHRVTHYYGKIYVATLDLRKKRDPLKDVRQWIFDDATIKEMREIGYGKVQKFRLSILADGAEIWLVTTKRFDPEGGEEMDEEEESETV